MIGFHKWFATGMVGDRDAAVWRHRAKAGGRANSIAKWMFGTGSLAACDELLQPMPTVIGEKVPIGPCFSLYV